MQKLLLLFALILSACSAQDKTIQLGPINPQQNQLIQQSLISGKMPSEIASLQTLTEFSGSRCQKFINSLPSDYFHGFLNVPEIWSDLNSPQIKVFYYGRHLPGQEMVLFHNGGPASDSHGSHLNISEHPHYNKFSFVFMDQRGTGCSTPFPAEINQAGVQRLLNYGSRAIVHDSEALRKKLLPIGTPWKVFGQSFGGRIVQRYLQIAPKSLVSAHSHGYSVMSDDNQWLALRLLSQKRVFQDYLKVYPHDEARIFKIRSQIADDQCFTSELTSVCGARVIDSLVIVLGFKISWPVLHQWVDRLLDKNDRLNASTLKEVVQSYVFEVYANNYAAGSIISWADFSHDQSNLQYCDKPMALLRQMGERPETWALNECRLMADIHHSQWDPIMTEFLKNQKGYADPILLPDLKLSLLTYPKLKFFLYSGQADVFVPVETFQEQVDFLNPLVRYINFTDSGHEGFLTEDRIWQDLAN